MQPLPEVESAAEGLAALTGELDVLQGLRVLSDVALALVPSVVGVSLTVVLDGEPFTVTATSDDTADLDAAQYLDGGPCADAATEQAPRPVPDVLDEERWRLYRVAAAARGVRSSLSLPLGGAAGPTPGAINLYASEPDAFAGREDLLAEVFQSPTCTFVRNADLTFMTRDAARHLPEQLERRARVDQAVGVLVAVRGWAPDEARGRLTSAADRAGTPLERVAEIVLSLDAG